jgi:hypothetical protein
MSSPQPTAASVSPMPVELSRPAPAVPQAPAAAAAESVWRRAWEGWKRFAHAFGVFQTRLIMLILYVLVVVPIGIVARLVSDPLHLRQPEKTNWVPLEKRSHSLESAQQQG